MYRTMLACCLLLTAALGGCDSRPEGVVTVETSGSLELIHTVRYTTESQDWDLRVDCFMEGTLGRETLHVRAYDNTFEDGFDIDLYVDDFDGDGSYHRTFNQPNPALVLSLWDDDTDDWTLNTARSGVCDFEIESDGRVGTVECVDVGGVAGGTLEFDDVQLSGSWTCTGLYWNNRSNGWYDDDLREDDPEEYDEPLDS